MGEHVCPWWVGYLLASPLRRLIQDPGRLLAPYVREGMTVLEPGPGMGFFTLELARRVGESGRVVAVDVQPRMLDSLKRRAAKAGLLARIDARIASPDSMAIADLTGKVDFALAFAVVHEMPSAKACLAQIGQALRPAGRLLLAEPAGHVKSGLFNDELKYADEAGLDLTDRPSIRRSYAALFRKR